MWRFLLAGLILSAPMLLAEDPAVDLKKPQHERKLTGDNAKRAAELDARIAALADTDKSEEARKCADEQYRLLLRCLGEDHWQVRDAKNRVAYHNRRITPEQKQRYEEAIKLQIKVQDLFAQGRYREANEMGEMSLRDLREVVGESHPNTVLGLCNLAELYQRQRAYAKAESLLNDALRIRLESLGEMHPETAKSLGNLAVLYAGQGAFAKAEPLHLRALRIQRNTLGDKHSDVATSLSNLAMLHESQAAYAKAEPLYQEALRIMRELRGEKDLDTANCLHNLAMMYKQQGAYAKAAPLCEDILRIVRGILGEMHPETARCIHSLAELYSLQAEGAKAEPLYQDALRITRETLGENHPDTARVLSDLASLYVKQREYAKAEPLYQEALRIRRAVLGEKHPNTAVSLIHLGTLYASQREYAKAEPLLQEALLIKRDTLGGKHPEVASTLNNLADLYMSMGASTKAEPLCQEALRIRREVFGEKHLDTAASLSRLGVLYRTQGALAKSEALETEALEIRRELRGEKHLETAASLHNLGVIYYSQRKYAKAEPLYQDALRIRRELLGETHAQTARSLNDLAALYYSQGEYAKAEPLLVKASQIRKETRDEEEDDTSTGLNNLAQLYEATGEYAKAERLYEDALQISRTSVTKQIETTLILHNLGTLHASRGEHVKAAPLLVEAANAYERNRLIAAKGVGRAVAIGHNSPYPAQAANFAALLKPRDAYAALELDLARGLLDEQADRHHLAQDSDAQKRASSMVTRLGLVDSRILQLATQRERTDAEQTELNSLVADRSQLESQLASLAVTFSQNEVATLAEIQSALPSDGALVLWNDAEHASSDWGCVIRNTGDPHWERLRGTGKNGEWTKADRNLPAKLCNALTAESDEFSMLAKQLHAQRLAPLAKHLADVRQVFAVPVREMAGVPLEVLSNHHIFSYVPSGTFLARAKRHPRHKGQSLLAVGDPVFEFAGRKPTSTNTLLPPGGLLINLVAAGGPAAKAGLKAGDVLVQYGGEELTSVEKLTGAIQAQATVKEVEILVWRDDSPNTFVRNIAPGKLGVTLAKESAREAITSRRKFDATLFAVRGGDWAELPGTRAEVSQLGRLFGADTTALIDSAASEQSLDTLRKNKELKNFRYLHFATHGQANNVTALESTLILAQDALPNDAVPKIGEPYIDGKLTASEVLEYWDLDAELVTLSACETALGQEAGGDGMLGFAQAFLAKGARSVCLSLWKVDDAATMLLMQRFYQNLLGKRPGLDKPMGKAAALAEAKHWLRNLSSDEALKLTADITKGVVRGKGQKALPVVGVPKSDSPTSSEVFKPFDHPKYWAAFILIGDPE